MGVLAVHSRPSGPGVYSSSGLAVAVVITDSQQMEWPGQKEGKIVAKGQVETKHPIKSEYVPKSIGDRSRLYAYFAVHFIKTSSPPADELAPSTCLCLPCKDDPVSDFNPRPPSDPWQKDVTYGQLITFLASLLVAQQCTGFDSSTSGQKRQCSGVENDGPSKRFRLDNNTDPGKDGAGGGENNNANAGGGSNGNESACAPDGKDSNPKKFACLFYKLDPEGYQDCESLKLKTWDRVLQHLKRSHVLGPVHCPTCRIHWPKEKEHADQLRNEHIQLGQCEPTSIETSGYLLAGEYNNLKNLGSSSRQDLKWFKAWERLFPRLPAPLSPFFESPVDVLRRNAFEVIRRVFLSRHLDDEGLVNELVQELFSIPNIVTRSLASASGLPEALRHPTHAPARNPGPSTTRAQRSLAQISPEILPTNRPLQLASGSDLTPAAPPHRPPQASTDMFQFVHPPYGSGVIHQAPSYQNQAGAMALHNRREMRMHVGLNQPQPTLANRTSLLRSGGTTPGVLGPTPYSPGPPQNSYNSNVMFPHVPDISLTSGGGFQNTPEWGGPNGQYIDFSNDVGYQVFPEDSRPSDTTPGPGHPDFSDFQYRDRGY